MGEGSARKRVAGGTHELPGGRKPAPASAPYSKVATLNTTLNGMQ